MKSNLKRKNMIKKIKEFFGWLRWKLAQRKAIRQAKKNDPYIYPPD